MNGELWRTVAEKLRGDIRDGVHPPGATMPSEAEISETFGVSRDTARKALGVLTQEGLLTAGRGRLGRQVRDSNALVFYATRSESRSRVAERKELGTDAWVTDASEQGRKAGQHIVVAIEDADEKIAGLLEIQIGSPVVVRHRLRTLDGEPHDRADSYYPAELVDGTPIAHPADIPEGVIAYMAGMGHEQVRYSDEVSARMPTPEEAREMHIPQGIPVLVQYRTGYTTERPVRVTIMIWPADRAKLVWELTG